MSQDPFKLIRCTDEPPETLRREVLGSVRFVTLMMRITQLFLADYAQTIFEKIRITRPADDHKGEQGPSTNPST